MSNTIWPKLIMRKVMKKYGRKITPCHPTPSWEAMHKVLDEYDHLTRTEDKPHRLHLCGNGSKIVDGKEIGHCCANPDHIKIGTHKENMNMPDAQSAEKRRKISELKKGENNPNWGKSPSDETKQKMREAMKGQPKVTCPHCGKTGRGGTMHRWHFDKCKLKDS